MAVSGADIVAAARHEIGDPYVWGATGPNRFDCSGLVQYVFGRFGIKTPRIAADQANFGQSVPRSKLQPGDLLFFKFGTSRVGHVGIYAGNGKLIHAPQPGDHVKEVTLSSGFWSAFAGAKRFPGVTGGPATSEGGSVLDRLPGLPGVGVPTSITEAIKGIGDELRGIGEAVASVGHVAELITKAMLPSSLVRGAAGILGTISILIGVWFLSREVRSS